MEVDLNRSLQIFQSARTLQKDDIRGLTQKDRKILSVLMTTILKSKNGCKMENVVEDDLATLDKDIKAGPPKEAQESGIVDKIGNFFKNIFSKRISSKSLYDKIEQTNKKVAFFIENENKIKEDKKKIEKIIAEKTQKMEEQEKTLVGIPISKELATFLKEFSAQLDGLDKEGREQAIKTMEESYEENPNTADPESAEWKSLHENLGTLFGLKETLQSNDTKGAKNYIKEYLDNNKNNPSEKEVRRQIEKSKNEIRDLKQQVSKLANQEAIINTLKS